MYFVVKIDYVSRWQGVADVNLVTIVTLALYITHHTSRHLMDQRFVVVSPAAPSLVSVSCTSTTNNFDCIEGSHGSRRLPEFVLLECCT